MKNPLAPSRPKLAAKIDAASADTQRALVLALLEHIYRQHAPIHNADTVLAAVRAGQYGDSPLRDELWEAHRAAEGNVLDYAEQIDDIEDTGQNAPEDLFRKIRAENQIHSAYQAGYHALDTDPTAAAAHVTYRAIYAANLQEVLNLVQQYLPDSEPIS